MSFVKLPVLSHGLTIRHEDIVSGETIDGRKGAARALMRNLNLEALAVYCDGAVNGPVCYLTNYPCYRLGRRAFAVLGLKEGPFLYTAEPSRNIPRARLFTSCDLENAGDFFSAACRRTIDLAKGDAIGLVGGERLSLADAVKIEKEFSGIALKDISKNFYAMMAAKDESSLKATLKALKLAEVGRDIVNEEANGDTDLWRIGALIDYRLRLLGCEDTNILLGCAPRGKIRPGYPDRTQPKPKDVLVAYVAVRYARHWGVVGFTRSVASTNEALNEKLNVLTDVQKSIASRVRADMTLAQVEVVVREAGQEKEMVFADDMPVVSGIGFDISEYPLSDMDRVKKNTVLQVVLAEDGKGEDQTVLRVDMLRINENGGVWLKGQA